MGALRAQLEDPRGKRHLGGAGTLAVGRGASGSPKSTELEHLVPAGACSCRTTAPSS